MHPRHDPQSAEYVATSYLATLHVHNPADRETPPTVLRAPAARTVERLDACLAEGGWERTSAWHSIAPGAPWSADVQRAPEQQEQPQVPTVREVNAARDRVRAYLAARADIPSLRDADNHVLAAVGGYGTPVYAITLGDLRAIVSDSLR